jgi:hypothetical protein
MARGITLERWSALLLEDVFRDHEGEGRPVSTIDAGGVLLARALTPSGVRVADELALELFISAFPPRWQMLRWFSGAESPGSAALAFLILCCVVASESAGTDANDYRERFRVIMGWDAVVMDCAGLPRLWKRLQTFLASSSPENRIRPLLLPDERHRTQIGHAIELTFPSRQDGRRLKRDLDEGSLADPDHPVAVMRWLSARAGRFSPTFNETFADFQAAWRSGARALVDHRFWSGWRVVVESWRPILTQEAFQIVSDEWGRFQLVTPQGDPTTLRQVESAASGGLRQLLSNGTPVLLREIDWGQWTWCGQGRTPARDARAALIREKSHSATVLSQLDRAAVSDAPGWVLTTAIDLLPGTSRRLSIGDDDLVDVRFAGVPRIDGGRLARPSFPIHLSTTGPVERVTLSGDGSDQIELRRGGPQDWLLSPKRALDGDVRVSIEAAGGDVVRVLSLRSSATATDWQRELPRRFVVDEASPLTWSPTSADDGPVGGPFDATEVEGAVRPKQGLGDLVEYLAARPGAMPLGGLLQLIDTLPEVESVGKWAVLRALLEGGLIEPLRVRGWRGGAVIPRPPRSVLSRSGDGFRLAFDGVINEVMVSRLQGMAARLELAVSVTAGLGEWSPLLLSIHGGREALVALASEAGVGCEHLTPSPDGHGLPVEGAPNADGSTHGSRQLIQVPDIQLLSDRRVRLFLCRRELEDAPPVWLIQAADGQPRYWSHRHLALLDACRLAAIIPFSLRQGRLTAALPGVFLPLAVARWLRLATGVGSGPSDGGYMYCVSPGLAPIVREVLGLSRPHTMPPMTPRAPRRSRGAGLALARGAAVDVTQVWRWARDQRGDVR